MTTPTQKHKQLAEEILRKFGNPDYTEEELTEEIPIVAQLLADAQAEEREVLRVFTRCPSCHNDTLAIHKGRLFCTWVECKEPSLIHRMGEPK